MSVFGKDYSEDIKTLFERQHAIVEQLNKNTKSIDELTKGFNNLQEEILTLAKVQAQHKETISFLLNNVSIDADDTGKVQKELVKMLSNISKLEEKK